MLGPGLIIGSRYEVVRLLGGGGMKQVWLARDLRLAGRSCALAAITDSFVDASARKQAELDFKREAELLASLSHEHIPQVYDAFSEANSHYLVMEFINGETLETRLQKSGGRLPESEALQIALQVSATLEYLHSLRPPVIYRDLKPSNLILKSSGRVMLIDFGIARHFQTTKTVTMVGTPGYAAPEQWRGKAEPRSDIYALGALLHQMVTARDPCSEPPCSFPPVRQIAPSCAPRLASLIDEALQYEPNLRIQSMSAVRSRLLEIRRAEGLATTKSFGADVECRQSDRASRGLCYCRRYCSRHLEQSLLLAAGRCSVASDRGNRRPLPRW